MEDKEKKAIEYLKEVKSWWWHNSPDRAYAINLSDIEQFDILLNLIEKQEKVIDEMVDRIEWLIGLEQHRPMKMVSI